MRKYGQITGIILGIAAAAALGGCGGSVGGESSTLPQHRDIGSEGIGLSQTGTESLAAENGGAVDRKNDGEVAKIVNAPEFSRELPQRGVSLSDFVPEGWVLLDSVELDFNEDGITDYVGVLEVLRDKDWDWEESGPSFDFYNLRILFAVASDGPGQYRLDFQDENLIPTRAEGGSYGDPYLPPTAEGTSFTTHEYGGSAWRNSIDCTYTYRDGGWYLELYEYKDGYGDYITSYHRYDWTCGTGICKERSTEWEEMEKHWDDWFGWEDQGEYDLVYEIALDEPPTPYQVGMRRRLSTDRVTDWEVKELTIAEGVELPTELIELPGSGVWFDYCDENCVIYTFSLDFHAKEQGSSEDRSWKKDYLALYRWQEQSLEVVAEAEHYFQDIELYRDKIYFSMEVIESIAYKSLQGGEECIEEGEETVGVRLNRMNVDGTGLETIFEYRYPGTDQPVLEERPPCLGLYYTVSGGELVATVFDGGGDGTHLVYRMNVDGSGQRQIGRIPKE